MPVLFAVHISDGVLGWPALAIGFALAAVLAAVAAWRVRDEEIPRIALMTAAFFVASSIHVKLGPLTSAHLLLNGLVGVVLGWRAPLAILVGVTLQVLIPHGGVSTIGVNTCTEAVPALLAAGLFALVSKVSDQRRWFRSLLVGLAALVWGGCLVFGVAVLFTVRLAGLVNVSTEGVLFRVEELTPALAVALRPASLLVLAACVVGAVVAERQWKTSADFARGALVGVLAVMGTAALAAGVLLAGTDRAIPHLDRYVTALFLAHLPLALVEGLVTGCVVAFLGRVKPQMLASGRVNSRAALLALAALGLSASPAHAHKLLADYVVDRANREVLVFCTYQPDVVADGANVTVRGADGEVVAQGESDGKGRFTFRYDTLQDWQIEVRDGGHVGRGRSMSGATEAGTLPALLAGVALVLAAAAFVMAWRNRSRIARLERESASQPAAVREQGGGG